MLFKEIKEFIILKQTEELPSYLKYHSIEHILDVYESCKLIAAGESVAGEDLDLILTAALFHDSGFIVSPKEHETTSCEFAKEYLPKFEYTEIQIERICEMIMATKIPQTPKDLYGQILADADLDYLGRDDFFEIGETLFEELKTLGVLNTELEWNRIQVNFLEKHSYFTKTSIFLRKEKKDYHLQLIKNKLI